MNDRLNLVSLLWMGHCFMYFGGSLAVCFIMSDIQTFEEKHRFVIPRFGHCLNSASTKQMTFLVLHHASERSRHQTTRRAS
jgi:hypothetical protein